MAPRAQRSPLLYGYATATTPETDATKPHGSASSSRYHGFVGLAVPLLVVASVAVYVFGQLAYFTPVYTHSIAGSIQEWWGVPSAPTRDIAGASAERSGHGRHSVVWAPISNPLNAAASFGSSEPVKGHAEMVLPTYFILFALLPLLTSALLIESSRHGCVRRVSSQFMLKVAILLRRKPALFGKVSYWSYGEWVFFCGLVGGNVFVFYHFFSTRCTVVKARATTPLTFNSYLETVAVTFGFSCIFNMAFLFLPATRNSAWMEFFNISYATGIKYHRWLGILVVLAAFLHCVGFYWAWLRQGTWKQHALPCFDCDFATRKGHKVWMNVFGQLALLAFLIIGLTSIPFVRRKFYNIFYYSHQLLFLAMVFAVMHWISIIWWIFPSFIFYCYGRAMSIAGNLSPIMVKEFTAIDQEIVKVVLKRSPGRDGHYRVGQFLYLNVPAISTLQWHAFTIASAPRTSPTTVTVLIKGLGDWTNDLVGHANECTAKNVLPTIYVDGFYGASLEMYDEYSTVLLIGGGIGVTPLLAILEDIAARLVDHQTLQQKVVFAFSFRELALLEEIHPVLLRLRELDPQEQYFKTLLYLTRRPSEAVLTRRVDTNRLHGKLVRPTTYMPTVIAPMAFSEPLRSRMSRTMAFSTVVAVGLVLLLFLEYGGGTLVRGNQQRWPLQAFVNAVVMIASASAVFVYVFVERLLKLQWLASSTTSSSKELQPNGFQTPVLLVSDILTYSDLLSHHKVVVGELPNATAIVKEAYEFHNDTSVPTYGKPIIGVFVSGPEAMKRSVECAVHEIGASHFDMHEEEFEL